MPIVYASPTALSTMGCHDLSVLVDALSLLKSVNEFQSVNLDLYFLKYYCNF